MNHTHTQKVFSIFLKTQSPSPGRCFSHTLDMNPPGETINRWPNNRARVSATQRAPTASESKRNAPFPSFFCVSQLSLCWKHQRQERTSVPSNYKFNPQLCAPLSFFKCGLLIVFQSTPSSPTRKEKKVELNFLRLASTRKSSNQCHPQFSERNGDDFYFPRFPTHNANQWLACDARTNQHTKTVSKKRVVRRTREFLHAKIGIIFPQSKVFQFLFFFPGSAELT